MDKEQLGRAHKVTVVIGLAMMASLVIYTILVEFFRIKYAPFKGFNPMPEVADILRYVLLGVSVVIFFVIRVLNRALLSAKGEVRSAYAASCFTPDIQKLMTAATLTYALCESVAIFGLVLFLIQGRSDDYYLFLAISVFYFAVFFPRYSTWEERIEEQERDARR